MFGCSPGEDAEEFGTQCLTSTVIGEGMGHLRIRRQSKVRGGLKVEVSIVVMLSIITSGVPSSLRSCFMCIVNQLLLGPCSIESHGAILKCCACQIMKGSGNMSVLGIRS